MGPCLGRGGFGEVYRAVAVYPSGVEAEVAVKLLRADLGPASQAVLRLRDEGRLLARLDHPVILRVHDLTVLDGRAALVTEFVEGDDLGVCMTGLDPIGPRALCEVLGQVAAALAAAWATPGDEGEPLRLVHRDVKPSNVRLSRHGQVKLLDFGIARADVDREARTQTEITLGSPAYMAPERFTDLGVRPASDVFAIGCVLYEGLVHQRLFADVPMLVMTTLAVDEGRFQAFLDDRMDLLPEDLEPVLRLMLARCLHWAPHKRPLPHELAASLDALADALPGPGLAVWCRSRSWIVRTESDGALQGRILTEGTLAREIRSDSRRAAGAVALAAAGVAALSVLVLIAALVLLAPSLLGPLFEAPTPTATVAPPGRAAPEPPETGGAPTTRAVAAPPPAAEAPRTRTPGAVAPVTPSPADPEPPVDAPAETESVSVAATGDASAVSLVRNGTEVRLPGQVAPGTWTVRAWFDATPTDLGTVEVVSGAPLTLHCQARFSRCRPD